MEITAKNMYNDALNSSFGEFKGVLEDIKNAANSGKLSLKVFEPLKESTIKLLEDKGFIVKQHKILQHTIFDIHWNVGD